MFKQWIKQLLKIEDGWNYRQYLFDEYRSLCGGSFPKRILEVGPMDGLDTRRLLTLNPDYLLLVDLPTMQTSNEIWLKEIQSPALHYLSANVMYSPDLMAMPPFDLLWCTGVLYHNPEQLRMIKRLFDLIRPGGHLVIESATTRQRLFQNKNCVEIIYPPSESYKRRYHVSLNVTHLPSAKAIESWLQMIGFQQVTRSDCYRKVSRKMNRTRAAFIAQRPVQAMVGRYHTIRGEEGYVIGNSN